MTFPAVFFPKCKSESSYRDIALFVSFETDSSKTDDFCESMARFQGDCTAAFRVAGSNPFVADFVNYIYMFLRPEE